MIGPTPNVPFVISFPVNVLTNNFLGFPVFVNGVSVGTASALFSTNANAPTIPFNESQIGGYQRQPNGDWQRSSWDGSNFVPIPDSFATPTERADLDRFRQDYINWPVEQRSKFEEYIRRPIPFALPDNLPISFECNRDYTAARGWTLPRDPLVLDLDGDGIETVGIDPLAPILFDHDADGVKTGTGWIQSDDGLLVLDRNGNGTIDGGAELFGDNTRTGVNQSGLTYAANGYIALQGQDSNADDQINSQDTSYTQLRVWRDLNQDGISQAGELQTLGQAGIASIGVAGTATNVNLAAMKNGCAVGNTQIASGSFTRTNGTTGQSGTAELTGSYLLAGNNFYRAFNDNPVLPTAAQNLPQMPGSGWVRDMREAASLGTHICTPRCTSTAENRYALRSCRRNILLRYSRKRPVETLVPLGNQKYICAIAKTA